MLLNVGEFCASLCQPSACLSTQLHCAPDLLAHAEQWQRWRWQGRAGPPSATGRQHGHRGASLLLLVGPLHCPTKPCLSRCATALTRPPVILWVASAKDLSATSSASWIVLLRAHKALVSPDHADEHPRPMDRPPEQMRAHIAMQVQEALTNNCLTLLFNQDIYALLPLVLLAQQASRIF